MSGERASLMVFRGGPRDGVEASPERGFPAPGRCWYPAAAGRLAQYDRVDTVEGEDGTVRHMYDYRGEAQK